MSKSKSLLLTFVTAVLIGGGLAAYLFFWLGGGVNTTQAAPTAIWYVNAATGDDGNNCTSPGDACQTIAAAVDKAADDDTIQIAAGTYVEHDIEIFKRLTLIGDGAGSTILDGNQAGRVLRTGAETTVSGVTIQNGATITESSDIFVEGGGAILNNGDLTIQDSVIQNNSALGLGGAIFTLSGALVIENSEIISNTADGNGGAIYGYLSAGTISVTDSLLANNTAVSLYGGAVDTTNDVYLNHVIIDGNSSTSFGGGLNINATAIVENSLFTGNESSSGAALFSQSGAITLTNVTVSENTASNNQGGIYGSGPAVSFFIQNSTIANNHRTNTGGTGYNGLMIGNDASAQIVNTIFAGNDGQNCGGTSGNWTSLGNNLSTDFSCSLTQTGDQEGVDPLLAALADYGGATLTHALLPNSPAIDAGANALCPAADQRDVTRPYDGDNDGTATCDIGAVEAQHRLIIEDAAVVEGNSGTVSAVFTVTLSPDHNQTVTVDYATSDGTATAGSDYTAVSDSLTFNPGQTTQFVTVPIIGDTSDETDETFMITLSNANNAVLLDGTAVGTIIDDDGLPTLIISDQTVLEGDSGTTDMVFDVTLSPASADTVTVNYDTVSGSAAAGEDYTAVSDTLTFTPGQTSGQIIVPVIGDDVDEGDSEAFTVQFSAPVNANIDDGVGNGTITDDDSASLSHELGPQVLEGNSGLTPAVFTVTLSTPADFVITVDYAVSSGFGDDGAQEGSDFISTPGTLTFQPGETVQNYTVQVIGDTIAEADEHYSSLISNANVPISVSSSNAMILNDDAFDYMVYLPLIVK